MVSGVPRQRCASKRVRISAINSRCKHTGSNGETVASVCPPRSPLIDALAAEGHAPPLDVPTVDASPVDAPFGQVQLEPLVPRERRTAARSRRGVQIAWHRPPNSVGSGGGGWWRRREGGQTLRQFHDLLVTDVAEAVGDRITRLLRRTRRDVDGTRLLQFGAQRTQHSLPRERPAVSGKCG